MTDLKANIKITAKDEASVPIKKVAAEAKAAASAATKAAKQAQAEAKAAVREQNKAAREVAKAAKAAIAANKESAAVAEAAARAKTKSSEIAHAAMTAQHNQALEYARILHESRTAKSNALVATSRKANEAVATSLATLRSRGEAVTQSFGRVKDSLLTIGKVGLGALAAAGFAFKGFLDTAAEFESLRTQLESIEGSSGKAEKAMSWIRQFAKETPGSVKGVTEAYVLLRNFGLDPLNGTMQAVMDTTSKFGFTQDRLMGISLALGQAWTKNKLQGQEINQLTERGVPVVALLAKAMGKTTSEIYGLSEAGKLGHKEIQLLINAMGKAAAGSSARAMTTWAGTVARVGDAWENFKLEVMESGPFDKLKGRLTGLLDKLDAMEKDGSLKKFAADVGKQITEVITWFEKAAVNAGKVVDAFGGIGNTMTIVAGLFAVKPVWQVADFIRSLVRATSATWAYVAAKRAANAADAALPGGGKVRGVTSAAGGLLPKAATGVAPALAGAALPLAVGALGIGAAAYGAYQMNETDQAERATAGSADRRRARFLAGNAQLQNRYGGQKRIEAAAQRQEVGGTIKIEVDDNRTRVTRVSSKGGVQLDVAGGLNLGGTG